MCASPQQYVDVHLSCHNQQAIGIPRGDGRVAMSEAYSQRPVCNDFGEAEAGGFGVEIAFHNLEIGCDGA